MKYFVLIALLVSCLGCSEEDVADVVDPHLFKTIDIPKGDVRGLQICVSPDGRRFASGIDNFRSEMNVWHISGFLEETFSRRENNLVAFSNPPEPPINGIVFSPTWDYFATFQQVTRRNKGLNIWARGWLGGRFDSDDLPDHGVALATFDTKGKRLAYVDQSGPRDKTGNTTHQVTVLSGQYFRESVALEDAGQTHLKLMAFDGDRLVARAIHDALIMWDLSTGKIIFRNEDWEGESGSDILMFSPDGKQFVVIGRSVFGRENSSGGGGIEIRDSNDGSLVKKTLEYKPLAISRDWKWFATTSESPLPDKNRRVIQIHGMENGEIEFTLTGHTGRIEDMDFSADGSRLVSVASDRTFKIWDLTK